MMRRVTPDLSDIQGNILRPYAFAAGRHLFVRAPDARAGRRWLTTIARTVTSAEPWAGPKPAVARNVALSYAGLEALGAPASLMASFPEAFRAGMAARAAQLGDEGASAPRSWQEGLSGGSPHVLVSVLGRKDAVDEEADEIRNALGAFGVEMVFDQPVHALRGSREHFGFADGFSQPTIKGVDPTPGADGVPGRFGRQHPLPLGEFIHGYADLDGWVPPGPAAPLDRNGCYLVWRKLAQDVDSFRTFVRNTADEHGIGQHLLAAKIVGRWRDGSPLALRPDRPDPKLAKKLRKINRFDYGDDPDGLACPLGSHVRRANPRNSTGLGPALTARHRMIRRGMPYGPPLPEHADEDDGHDRGLIFVAFVADIERQFEFVQRHWCNDGETLRLGSDRDPLIGGRAGTPRMKVPGRPPLFLNPLPEFVTTRGGEYFYVPGIRGLRGLVAEKL